MLLILVCREKKHFWEKLFKGFATLRQLFFNTFSHLFSMLNRLFSIEIQKALIISTVRKQCMTVLNEHRIYLMRKRENKTKMKYLQEFVIA